MTRGESVFDNWRKMNAGELGSAIGPDIFAALISEATHNLMRKVTAAGRLIDPDSLRVIVDTEDGITTFHMAIDTYPGSL